MLTGEPIPVEKHERDRVTGATVNGTGQLMMRAERVGSETLLAQIVRMVSEAQRSRAPIQKLADMVAGYFVPAVVGRRDRDVCRLGLDRGPSPRMAYALVNAVAVLIIACPCALGLATPMSIMVGHGRGAQAGVLIRNAEAIETDRKGGHAGDGQDRNAHGGQAEAGFRSASSRRPDRKRAGSAAYCREPGTRQRASARGSRIRGAARARRFARIGAKNLNH